LHSAPIRTPDLEYYHWHIEIIPKLTRVAGFEWGTGFYINPTSPEDAAEFLGQIPIEKLKEGT
jgi:UDPglucose--hexose-1-phosphate uridylyltransferase